MGGQSRGLYKVVKVKPLNQSQVQRWSSVHGSSGHHCHARTVVISHHRERQKHRDREKKTESDREKYRDRDREKKIIQYIINIIYFIQQHTT